MQLVECSTWWELSQQGNPSYCVSMFIRQACFVGVDPPLVRNLHSHTGCSYGNCALLARIYIARYDRHTCSFRDKSKRYNTTLSNYILTLKDSNTNYTIRWKTVDRGRAYSPSTKICNLCLKEKYVIICKPQMASLNSRNELKTECRHRKKHLLYKL